MKGLILSDGTLVAKHKDIRAAEGGYLADGILYAHTANLTLVDSVPDDAEPYKRRQMGNKWIDTDTDQTTPEAVAPISEGDAMGAMIKTVLALCEKSSAKAPEAATVYAYAVQLGVLTLDEVPDKLRIGVQEVRRGKTP